MGTLTIPANIAQVPNVAPIAVSVNHAQLQQTQYLRYAKVQLEGEVAVLLYPRREDEDTEAEFNKLAKEWKATGRAQSLVSALVMRDPYQKIIGLGKPAIPYILRELDKNLDHWFWALEMITRKNPVPEESKGDIEEMARIWLQWGCDHGYVW